MKRRGAPPNFLAVFRWRAKHFVVPVLFETIEGVGKQQARCRLQMDRPAHRGTASGCSDAHGEVTSRDQNRPRLRVVDFQVMIDALRLREQMRRLFGADISFEQSI
jgi:hypothetical protein